MSSPSDPKPRRPWLAGPRRDAAFAATMVLLGAAIGAGGVAATRPAAVMAPMSTVAINTLGGRGIVSVRGTATERYGSRFVLTDPTGHALVEAGPGDAPVVHVGEAVTVQGRFERHVLHAAFLVRADGKVEALGPLAGPPPPPGREPGHLPGPPFPGPGATPADMPPSSPAAPPTAPQPG